MTTPTHASLWPANDTTAGAKPLAWHQSRVPYVANANELQNLTVWLPLGSEDDRRRTNAGPAQPKRNGLWVVYIHGGAWKDPLVDSSSFDETVKQILSGDARTVDKIAGLASINYSLSPNPQHPTHPAPVPGPGVESIPSRSAKHPDHIVDVLTALSFLSATYGMSENYVLAGHSCGATLAFQVVMDRVRLTQDTNLVLPDLALVPRPIALLGLNGLYDLPTLIAAPEERYTHMPPLYRDFTMKAFGADEDEWKVVSPAYTQAWSTLWPEGRRVVLTQSHEDSLVPYAQTEIMLASLRRSEHGFEIDEMDVDGDHNDLWKQGMRLAQIVTDTVNALI